MTSEAAWQRLATLINYLFVFVKIDGEFIQNVKDNPVSQAIVSSIQHIAQVMGLTTIAERIEEPELLEHLPTHLVLASDKAMPFTDQNPCK